MSWEMDDVPTAKPAGSVVADEADVEAVRWVEEKLGFRPDAVQARVLDRRTKRGILNCSRQWGKSTVTALKAVWEAHQRPESLTIVVSPSERQSAEFVRKASVFVRRLQIPAKGDGDNDVSLVFPNHSRIVGLPGSEATVRGFSNVSLLLVDEASRVSDELYHAIRPMLAVSNGALWLMSTPAGKRGFFYETWMNGGPDWMRIRAMAQDCGRIAPKFLEEERTAMGERMFRQEYCCEFVETSDVMFKRSLIESAFTDEFEELKLF